MTPDELRKLAEAEPLNADRANAMLAAADAWEADRFDLVVYKNTYVELSKRLEEAKELLPSAHRDISGDACIDCGGMGWVGETDAWKGKAIVLYRKEVRVGDDIMPAIRIKIPIPVPAMIGCHRHRSRMRHVTLVRDPMPMKSRSPSVAGSSSRIGQSSVWT